MSFFVLLFLILLFIILWPVAKIAFKIFSFHRQMKRAYRQTYAGGNADSGSRRKRREPASDYHSSTSTGRRRSKRIPADIGEYIDFEELPYTPEPPKPPVRYVKQEQISDAEWEEIKL